VSSTIELSPSPAVAAPSGTRRFYVPVRVKLWASLAFALAWVAGSVYLAVPWAAELSAYVPVPVAWTIIALVALLPGGLVSFLGASLAQDRQPALTVSHPTAAVTVVIAARNEQDGIGDTIRYVATGDYDGPVTVVLADNGSTDATVERARAAAQDVGVELVVVTESRPGKSHALNAALAGIETPYVLTVDADTLLHPQALRRLVARLESAPSDTVAVAGAVLVRNSRTNLLTRMQEWDYYLGIQAVKRTQGLYQSTLVAQGAFSIYRTAQMKRIGGWPDAIGEDIVVTWRLMEGGDRVFYEPTAVAFTDAPTQVRHFMRQRARWARGMLEGLRAVPPWRQARGMSGAIASIDLLIPLLDIGYGVLWLGGLLLALLGLPIIVGWWTLLVLPVTLLVYGLLRRWQSRRVFAPLGLQVRRNRSGYVAFLLLYQVLCSWASLAGYTQHLLGTTRRWK
jgi:biofilm PGA synthesis N-glycosyltransferase PgaC